MRRLLAIALFVAAVPSALAAGPRVPVEVGGYDDLDACLSYGRPQGLNPRGDNFLAVRAGPGSTYRKIDELHSGDGFYICDETDNGWVGIVYGDDDDCDVSSPIDERMAYDGPCLSGWVYGRYVEVTAG